jgi:pimeloyl-ACP methyl ester carboxylesterase
MLPFALVGEDGPLIVMLHWLGGSGRTWQAVSHHLALEGMCCAAVDLPGFGGAASFESNGLSNEDVVAEIIASIRALRDHDTNRPWLLAGHSMGGKLAMLIAHAAQKSVPGLGGLRGLILISPSPVSPEPMQESKRAELLELFSEGSGDEATDRKRAGKFVDENTGRHELDAAVREGAIQDLLRMDRRAFTAWLSDGSREDWAERVGVLPYPALMLAGSEEEELGPKAQRQLSVPHLSSVTLVELEGGGHLAPLERAAEVADRISAFARQIGLDFDQSSDRLSPAFQQLLDSDRTSPQTRAVMRSRMEAAAPDSSIFDAEERLTLRALVRCVVPGASLNLAMRLEQWLREGSRDGWRFNTLPADTLAWNKGLTSLDAAARREYHVPFAALHAAEQTALLREASAGKLGQWLFASLGLGHDVAALDAAQMEHWFEDVRSALARLYIADPRTMERIGFTGFADEAGFTHIRLGESQAD